uniref:Uncharacterized protein n=1 Tax=Pipistrellus kuhlii TaxID=59472 RepID=A0A7J8B620_PIPKU|nr:hypothetical protein mPipKuh1_016819 [Pipistrellus kuhlii]
MEDQRMVKINRNTAWEGPLGSPSTVVGKLISQKSQTSIVQQLKFLLRVKFLKLKLLLIPLLQNRLAQAVVFCGRATLRGPKSHMWLASCSLPTTGPAQQ